MLKKTKILTQGHSFHLVDPSPWPMICALTAFSFLYNMALYLHGDSISGSNLIWILLGLILFMLFWWEDVVREGTFEGQHTKKVVFGLRLGMLLFIVSEILFFFAFFWAFFHSSINPSISLGGVWPPAFLVTLNPWKIPLLNTILLLSSGAAVTWTHHAILWGSKFEAMLALVSTIAFAIIFTGLQVFEYLHAPFTISDSVYGATFYLATGFHGFHVFIGTCFLSVCLYRLYRNHFTRSQHFGFEAAAWYWHFVDVVWLFLFITIYWWGS